MLVMVLTIDREEPWTWSFIRIGWGFQLCLNWSSFPDLWRISSVFPIFRIMWERLTDKSYHPVSLLSVIGKNSEKMLVIGLLMPSIDLVFFLISSLVSGLSVQLQLLWQLYLIELLVFLMVVMLLELALDIFEAFHSVWYTRLFHKRKSSRVFGHVLLFVSYRWLRLVPSPECWRQIWS